MYNETTVVEFKASGANEPGSGGKKKKGLSSDRISGQRVAEFLDYGMTNPTEDDIRDILAKEDRIERVGSLVFLLQN